ncbi:MAG: 1-deoxy-D-xylulose-5-phosphate synthase [Selenomonadaceae bacterium]|nr:1-deoxy-D-xylulose-5-phosphate synthase [Selenomonadaceae bacterium]
MYLEKVNGPADVKALEVSELQGLADEVRAAVIEKVSNHGGHIGPNLGMVEATVALHYVFESPKDKIVYDVSHQSYPHKVITGRKEAFLSPEHYDDVTGYTNPKESEHDFFTVGHTSTSVSLALGLAKARDLAGRKENIIAVIGDGSLSGGEALEAIDYAGEYDKNLIIMVNDNDQSIAENHGGIYKNLRELRQSNGQCEKNIFKSMGLDYRYLEAGHDIEQLVAMFESVKDIDHPVVVHVHTIKGKGLPYAEKNREPWHWGMPFNVADGSSKMNLPPEDSTLHDSLIELLDNNPQAVVLNAGTPSSMGFTQEVRAKYVPRGQFVDVGIAEENAMAMISGIAKNGGTPVFGTYAPFLQRTYDQLSHDLCLNDNPATIIVLWAGIYGMNSNTHIALCDISFFAHVPNLVYLAPTNKEEYLQMFKFATTQRKHPVAIRMPIALPETGVADTTDYSILNKAKVLAKGSDVAIIGVSNMLGLAQETAKAYEAKTGKKATVINPCYLTGLDKALLESLKKDHSLVITLEDGQVEGGYGQMVASYYGDSAMKVKNFGISKAFHTEFTTDGILADHGMTVDSLVEYMTK